MDNPLRGIALILAATMLFSVSDAMAKCLSQTLPVTEIAWIRYIAFVALAGTLDARSGPGRFRARRPALQLLRGLALVGSAIFYMLAIRRMPMAEAAAVSFVSPVLITVLSVPVLGEVIGLRRWLAVLVGLLGVLVVVRPGTAAFQPAALFALASSLCWSGASVLTRKMAGGERATTTLLWSAVSGLLVLTALLPGQALWPGPPRLALAIVLGIVASTGQYLMVLAYRHAAASLLAPFTYVQLIWATALGWLVFAAWPDRWTWLGAAIIAGSGLYTAGRERARRGVAGRPKPGQAFRQRPGEQA